MFAFINQPVTSLTIDDNNPAVAGQIHSINTKKCRSIVQDQEELSAPEFLAECDSINKSAQKTTAQKKGIK
ncbi:hypothetical protein AL536_19270 [Vibrio fluvialis]|uniref:Orphan protein n=1 Tax=Vibrio fluvialis TaxID=676 RepID=A0ABM5XQX4_VIBFL|nr:hypothetical protein AL536_19270 [Vibrio fluvialis]AVH31508.1 hypothetical protein AL475_06285 [Vibrio fluvialis]KQH89417.1 hypothetical protein AMR75_12985 [Vibrio fluvialis]TRN08345.1 hypothetical protein DM586_18625 [Vibrio fluvialis]BEI21883.1 hypothetical protein KKIDH5335_02150 [Vibrio fluvialis]